MKKNIIIGVLTIITILALTFGYFQKVRADKAEEELAKELSMREEMLKHSQQVLEKAIKQANKKKEIAEEQTQKENHENSVKK
ncbi:MAG: hypothetical protein AB9846_14090 [Tenuifilaceae bacterium]